ncbi:MAG: phosphoribosyl-AMP cyclohydrolase [Chloroflexota bacterium]
MKLKFDLNGLLTAVVQDVNSKDILMVAMMNAEAFALTQETKKAHFWSRSRKKLWLKGETSGNILNVKEMWLDCDRDAVLVLVEPTGPVCHTGNPNCFFTPVEI